MGWDDTTKQMTYPLGTKIAESGGTGSLQQAVGLSSTSQDTLFATGDINPWARYKPYRSSDINSSPRTLMLSSLGFGTPPNSTSVSGFMAFYDDTEYLRPNQRANGWRYLRPRPGQNPAECMRVYDFLKMSSAGVPDQSAIGYHGNALMPFGTFIGPTPASIKGGNIGCAQRRRPQAQTGTPDYDIVISDFNGLKYDGSGTYESGFLSATTRMLYYGMMLIPMDSNDEWDHSTLTGETARLIANTTAIDADPDAQGGKILIRGNEVLNVGYTIQDTLSARKYKVFPFLTNAGFFDGLQGGNVRTVTYANRSSAIGGGTILYPIPGAEPSFVTLYSDEIIVTVYCVGNTIGSQDLGYSARIYYTIENKTSSSVTISAGTDLYGLNLRIRNAGKDYADPTSPGAPETGEKLYSQGYYWDTAHPSGASSGGAYANLFPSSITVAASSTVRVPSTGNVMVNFQDGQRIYMGFYLGSRFHYGYVVPPVRPTPPTPEDLL